MKMVTIKISAYIRQDGTKVEAYEERVEVPLPTKEEWSKLNDVVSELIHTKKYQPPVITENPPPDEDYETLPTQRQMRIVRASERAAEYREIERLLSEGAGEEE